MRPPILAAVVAGCLTAGFAVGWSLRALGPTAALGNGFAERALETLAVADPLDRSFRWAALLEQAPADALPALRDAIARAPLDVGDSEVVSFAMWWARSDPSAALEWTSAEWRAQSSLVVGSIFRVWAHGDPEAAFAYIGNVAEFHNNAAIDATIVGWQESGKPGLLERVAALPAGVFRQRLGESLARRLVLALGTEGAMSRIEALTDPGFREMMTMRIASAAAEQGDTTAIAAWAAPRVTSGAELPSGIPRRIGTRWILRDPKSALAWLASLPAGGDRDDGVTESFRDWMRFAPGAAAQWIQNAELERWSEPAFAIYARRIGKQDPETALALVARFTDEELRNRTTTVIARQWVARDPKSAAAWLARADIPADVRARASGEPRAGAGPQD
jgi:hypothetical protein